MKILDPGSVVRESEFATAANSAGVPDRIRNQYNRILRGERLAPNQRKDFVDRANQLFEGQRDSQVQLENSFRALAISQGMKPEEVIIDFIGEFRPAGKGSKKIAGINEGAIGAGEFNFNPATGKLEPVGGGQ